MRKRNNPIPLELQRTRHIGFADEEQKELPSVYNWGNRNCDGEAYENLDLRHIDFTQSSLVGTSFIKCDMRGCRFDGSNIVNTKFNYSDLRNAIFSPQKANAYNQYNAKKLESVSFEECDLRDAVFGHDGNYLSCIWNNTNMERTKIPDKGFFLFLLELRTKIDPSIYIYGNPDFAYANLKNTDLRGANLQGAKLHFVSLKGADLQGANLQGANLSFADLRGANLQDADLQGASLLNIALESAKYNIFTKGLTKKRKSVMEYVDANED